MEKLKYKKFQIFDWSDSDFNNNSILIKSNIYESVNKIKALLENKKYAVAIGLNPSNNTIFNEDMTNLYLRDKIHTLDNKLDGYILVNLVPLIKTEVSENILIENIDEEYIEDIINLLKSDTLKGRPIILFFGKNGLKLIINEKYSEFKSTLIQHNNIYYTTDNGSKTIHPGRCHSHYQLNKYINTNQI